MDDRVASTDSTFWTLGDDRGGLAGYRTLVEMVDDGVVQCSADGRLVAIDETFCELTNYGRDHLLGEPISAVFDRRDGDGNPDSDDDRSSEALLDLAGVDAPESIPIDVHTADGRRLPCTLRLKQFSVDDTRTPAYLIGIVEPDEPDTDDQPHQSMAETESTVASVLEEASVGVFVLDSNFDVAWINEATERYFGLDRTTVLGRNKRDVLTDLLQDRIADFPTFRDTVTATYDDNSYVEQFECRVLPGEDRELRWLEHRSQPISSGPYAGGRIELYYDVTDRRRRSYQLRRLNEAVNDWLQAESDEDAAERACRSLRGILDLEVNGVFRYEESAQTLCPIAISEPSAALFNEAPTFGRGEGIAWRVFETGNPEIYDDVRSDPDVYNLETPIRSEIILPIGDYGIIIAGSEQPGAFDRGDLSLLKIAASSLEATFNRIENERQLEREHVQMEKLLQTAPVAIAVTDADGEIVQANRHAVGLPGFPTQQTVDTEETPTLYDADGDPLPLERTPAVRAWNRGEPVVDVEIEAVDADGHRTWSIVNAAPIFDADGNVERVITVGEDISELKTKQRQLERRKSELETELSEILGRISDAFYALDEECRFTHVNERAAELLQCSPDELRGRQLADVYPVETAEEGETHRIHQQFHEAMTSQERVSFESYDGTIDAWLEFNVYPSETGLSVYFRDVTERKVYERQLEASNERLEQFAYAASHDLQEPLRMVSSYLRLIEQRYGDELDEDGREFLEYATDGADRMRNMIDGLLTYSRVETQGDPLEPIDLETVVAEVHEDLQLRIAESNAAVTTRSLPTARGDASQLRQVFQNLLSNAIEYSGDEPPEIEISSERDGPYWKLTVTDHGIGIDGDATERVFEVFQRLHSREAHNGTGIGLAVCKRIIERHDGDIWIESEPGVGTSVSFTLPATDQEH